MLNTLDLADNVEILTRYGTSYPYKVVFPTLPPSHPPTLPPLTPDMNKFNHGDTIRIISLPTHLKTADPMPMLRPPNLLAIGDLGQIIDRKPGNYWVVKFVRGAFLLEDSYFEMVEASDESFSS